MRRVTRTNKLLRARGSVAMIAALGLALAGCTGDEDTSATAPSALQINSPAQIAQESADNYDDNENGLITGTTLSRWMSDWENERPAGVEGRLIILQTEAGDAGTEYIAPIPNQVYSYVVDSSEWVQTRSNGVTETVSMVPDGATMDAFLKKYEINPERDMVVCAMGNGGFGQAMRQGRCWYMFRYWGTPQENLAVLNGENSWLLSSGQMLAGDFSATGSTPPNTGTFSVRDLPQDNTALQATIDDVFAATTPVDQNVTNDGVMIWDARGLNQYSAGEATELGQSGCAVAYCGPVADYMTTFQNAGSRQGHPNGTLQLQFTRFLDAAAGYSYKPKAELAAYLNGDTDANGIGFVDSTYQPVGAGNAYQPGDTIITYCETTFRAMITGTASAVILGLPTRFYDGAMTEWNSLSNIVTREGTPILPADSPWRADIASRSFFRPAADASLIEPRVIDDPYAANAQAIVFEDRLYKYGVSGGDSSGGGVAPPSNPCGG